MDLLFFGLASQDMGLNSGIAYAGMLVVAIFVLSYRFATKG
tara:strand:- start:293 stop:415 length:123 start_codon:yes stop_codon:yes gene_type:complete